MRYSGGPERTLSIAPDAYNGSVGANGVHKSITKTTCYAASIVSHQWNEVCVVGVCSLMYNPYLRQYGIGALYCLQPVLQFKFIISTHLNTLAPLLNQPSA